MSKVHVKVEHAISGIKRSQSVKYILRNTKDNFRVGRRKKPLKL